MKFFDPDLNELERLRPDPLVFDEELDFLPRAAEALEEAVGGAKKKTAKKKTKKKAAKKKKKR